MPHIRQSNRADLDLYINKIIGDEPHLARVRDISADGVFLYKLPEPDLADGTTVGLELMLPESDDIIWALGEVVREENVANIDGVAIRFIRIAEHDRQLIGQFVENRKAIQNEAA